jgi:hypothetical protein
MGFGRELYHLRRAKSLPKYRDESEAVAGAGWRCGGGFGGGQASGIDVWLSATPTAWNNIYPDATKRTAPPQIE